MSRKWLEKQASVLFPQQDVRPSLDSNCLTLMGDEKMILTTKRMKNYPACIRVKPTNFTSDYLWEIVFVGLCHTLHVSCNYIALVSHTLSGDF